MYIRTLRPEEHDRLNLIHAIAYEFPWEPPKPDAEPQPDDMIWWMAGEGDELFASVGVLPMRVRFDGQIVTAGGVGGVATLPQHRRGGAIRACIGRALEDMYARGDVFSMLYPFSRAYYRKFGYADGASVATWTIPFGALNLPDMGGSVNMILPGGDLEPLAQVYRAVAANWNLSVEETKHIESMKKKNWLKDCRYLYIWRDEAGVPAGAMMFHKKDRVMDCTTQFGAANLFLFRDVRAMAALLNFGKRFAADYDSIRFQMPQGVRADNLIGEGNSAGCSVGYNGMLRVVNVEKALEKCVCTGSGVATIMVRDPMLPQNTGTWRVEFCEGEANRVAKTDAEPDIVLPIHDFSQLIAGVRCAADLAMMPEAEIRNPDAPFGHIFRAKTCHLIDLF